MAIAVRNERPKVNSGINVTPMLDVMLVLLIIFMVITPMLHPGVPVDMAELIIRSPCRMLIGKTRSSLPSPATERFFSAMNLWRRISS
jgi:Biopolymer transport protein ExbD/TolR